MTNLVAISEIADQKTKTEQYKAALEHIITSGDVQESQEFIDHGA